MFVLVLLYNLVLKILQIIFVFHFCYSGAESMPCAQYEFPNGFHRDFGEERIKIPEMLFDPSQIKVLID